MSLSSLYLDAFVGVAKAQSFSGASRELHITQSALSQRIKNLEDSLGLTVFLRTSGGIKLTEQGQKLLRYCQTKDSLEQELIDDLHVNTTNEISGVIRIGAYSSILRSAVIPSLSELLKANSKILCEFQDRQVEDLAAMLNCGEVDFIIMDHKLEKANLEFEFLGQETFVVIENTKGFGRKDVFLDNNYKDRTTESFFRLQQGNKEKYRRSYFDDCYGIIQGVEMGLGRAVMPSHLIKNNKSIRVSKDFKELKQDVFLHYHFQPIYSKLHQSIISELKTNMVSKYLK